MTLQRLLTITLFLTLFWNLPGQKHPDQIYVDDHGIMRWSADNSELHGFGVNYTLPFAHEYRMTVKSGINPEEAIRQDVYHMARLDLDLYRVHVWDTEISDTVGNLLNNEHLKLFDFTVNEMKKRGIRFIITPIAYWGNGWPEPDEPTPGFSHKYGKGACLTNPDAIEAQAKYLNQFLKHVNSYTGIAYKDDPQVIGFEICNEPHHSGPPEKVTSFINKMVQSMRETGCTKPIFYNMSHSISLAGAYLNADVQGGTFQWYPTNLVANHQINGNFLPHVETYDIPFANDPKFKKMAKIVYEFDPADAGGNILYTAMARTFRETGIQLAAQFAYDAMCWAPFNTNYGTHFMNLAYAPHKAISLKIASAVFHYIPMYQKQNDPTNFDGFRISYPEDLVEWNTDERFFYSNNTQSKPSNSSRLKEITGCGSSHLVQYTGTGAYFLDKLSDGVWRLEVMPDAYWIEDPYSPVNPKKQKAAVIHQKQQMTLSLPNLGSSFSARAINSGNTADLQVTNGILTLTPGVYILTRQGIATKIPSDMTYKNIRINEFVAPASNLNKTVLWNYSPAEVMTGKSLQLKFQAVSTSPIHKISVVLSSGDKWKTKTAVYDGSGSYILDVPSDLIVTGFLNYRVILEDDQDTTKFPGGIKGNPWSWDNRNDETYKVRIVPESSPIILWDAATDWENTYKIWNRSVDLKPTPDGGTGLSIQMGQLPDPDPKDNKDRNYAFKYFFGEKVKGRSDELTQMKFLVIKASDLLNTPQPIEVGLTDRNGSVLAGEINITPEEKIFRIPLQSLVKASYLIIPRPYPDFLPYKIQTNSKPFDWTSPETLQVIVKQSAQENVNLNIEKIWLENDINK